MGLVVEGRDRQHQDQAQGVGRCGEYGADPDMDRGQHGQGDATDAREGQADHMHDQVGGLFRRRPVMLGHVLFVRNGDLHQHVFQSLEHGRIKPFPPRLSRPTWGRVGDHSLNVVVMGDEGGGMRQKRHDFFRAT